MNTKRRAALVGFGAAAASLGAGFVEAGQRGAEATSESTRRISEAVEELARHARAARAQEDPPVIRTIREAQTAFLRANQRFPACIEVGISVWEQMWDWHVHTGQQVVIGQVADGRYGMTVFLTTLVLHPGAGTTYVGPGSATL